MPNFDFKIKYREPNKVTRLKYTSFKGRVIHSLRSRVELCLNIQEFKYITCRPSQLRRQNKRVREREWIAKP